MQVIIAIENIGEAVIEGDKWTSKSIIMRDLLKGMNAESMLFGSDYTPFPDLAVADGVVKLYDGEIIEVRDAYKHGEGRIY